jgi:hypothetical protein
MAAMDVKKLKDEGFVTVEACESGQDHRGCFQVGTHGIH